MVVQASKKEITRLLHDLEELDFSIIVLQGVDFVAYKGGGGGSLPLNLPTECKKILSKLVIDIETIDELIDKYFYNEYMEVVGEICDKEFFVATHKPSKLMVEKNSDRKYLVTLNGVVAVNKGDYIITGVNGEKYPCDPEIFKKLYDVA